MKWIILLAALAVAAALTAQTEPTKPLVALATVDGFSVNGSNYSGTLKNVRDIYETGYVGSSVAVGDMFIDGTGRVYEITSTSAASFSQVTVVMTCLSDPVGSPVGTGQVWRPLENGQYPVAPDGNGQIGQYLQGVILSHNAAGAGAGASSGATAYRDTTLTGSGVVVRVTFAGDAPALVGSAGNYSLTFPDGSPWSSFSVTATNAAGATSGNDVTFTIVEDSGTAPRANVSLIDLGTGQVVSAPKLEYGITATQIATTGTSLSTTYVGVGGLTGFTLNFVR